MWLQGLAGTVAAQQRRVAAGSGGETRGWHGSSKAPKLKGARAPVGYSKLTGGVYQN